MLEIALAWLPQLFSAAILTRALAAVIFAISGALGLALALLVRSATPATTVWAPSASLRSTDGAPLRL